MLRRMADTVPTYSQKKTNEDAAVAGGVGLAGGILSGAATGAAIGAPAGGIAAVPGAILGGIIGGVLAGGASAAAAGHASDQAQKTDIADAQRQRRLNEDAKMDAGHNARAAGAANTDFGDMTAVGSSSPYSGGSAYDTYHAQKWG